MDKPVQDLSVELQIQFFSLHHMDGIFVCVGGVGVEG